jgi:hypothetical protein
MREVGQILRYAQNDKRGRAQSMGEAGMIRFVKMAVFLGVQQLFFIRKAITSGRFSC